MGTSIEQIGILVGIVTGVFGIVIGVSSFIYAAVQSRRQRKHERLYFLANLIVDKSIPRKSRQIFFDEYIAKGGNGSFVKFWFDEEKELEAKK
ncbi:MAG: hypothetical protein LBT00_01760 [Spirochaetaceae bacterium]|jgi:hypothetical protein|nr:hypothetical protein [Spirochaetaceae bacterium]